MLTVYVLEVTSEMKIRMFTFEITISAIDKDTSEDKMSETKKRKSTGSIKDDDSSQTKQIITVKKSSLNSPQDAIPDLIKGDPAGGTSKPKQRQRIDKEKSVQRFHNQI